VTTAEIAAAVKVTGGQSIDRRKIEIGQPIKSVGEYKVQLRMHPEVSATITVNVVAG